MRKFQQLYAHSFCRMSSIFLSRYLGYAPKWVRYATSTPEQPNLPRDLLKPDSCQPGSMPAWEQSFAKYGFGQVPP